MKKANPAAVGAFVLGAAALVLVGVIALGSGTLLRETQRFVLYFDGSVNGLTAGSPVKIRGVEIGGVLEVNALADLTHADVRTQVIIQIDPARFQRIGTDGGTTLDRTKQLIERGLRARLEVNSLVTGQLYVGLDFYPDSPVNLVGMPNGYPELPTVPSVSQEVETTVRALAARVQALPLEDMARNLNGALAGVEKLVNSEDLGRAVAQLDDTMTEVRSTVNEARRTVAEARVLLNDIDGKVAPVADSAVGALDQTRATLAAVQGAVGPGADLRYELMQTLEALSEAARAVRTLADYVERNPNSVVFGRKSGDER